MWIVIYLPKGSLQCEQTFFGPFDDYMAAEDHLCTLPAAINCEHKYIEQLTPPDDGDAVGQMMGRNE